MIANSKMRRTSPLGKVGGASSLSLSSRAPAVVDTKQGRLAAASKKSKHSLQLNLKEATSSSSLYDEQADEAAMVRALLQKAAGLQEARKAAYLRRCVEDAGRQPAPKPDYFTTVQRSKITPDVRANIVTWLLRCNEMFGLLAETGETCVYLLDRLLSAAHIPTEKHVRIVAATCMLIAAKTCEQQGQGIMVRDLVRACGAVFSANDIQRMERVILGKFGWAHVGKIVTPYTVVAALMDVASFVPTDMTERSELRDQVVQLVADSLAMPWYCKFSVVEITCGAVLCVLNRYLDDPSLKNAGCELVALTNVDLGTVDKCARKMRSAMVNDVPMVG